MNLEKPRRSAPFPEPLAVAIKAFLTPRDKKILIAFFKDRVNDAELAAVFGPDALDRVAQISDGVGKLLRLFNELERQNETDGAAVAKETDQ